MGKYLKLFQNHTEYEAFLQTDDFIKPNVSHCIQQNDVHYNPWTWAEQYLTMVAREDGTISFYYPSNLPTTRGKSISYSINDGEWITTNNVEETGAVVNVTVSEGDNVRWKGDNVSMAYDSGYVYSVFASDCEVDLKGNIMSLLYGDDFKDNNTLDTQTQTCAFSNLFSSDYQGNGLKVVNAKNLILPADTLTKNCYQGMFSYCTSLTTAPELPATNLADWCYQEMFRNCTSLVTAPKLPATTLAHMCYSGMFEGTNVLPDCTNIDFTSQTVLASNGLNGLFGGTTVTYADLERILPKDANNKPCLPVTTLTSSCYTSMFYNCTSLTKTPELPATTLDTYCYDNMFYGCTSLTTVPSVLPAMGLKQNCYSNMFSGCTSLTTAPELPATTLVSNCYKSMFRGCSSLNYIKAMFTTTPTIAETQDWVVNVASTGTFVKNSAARWNVTGNNGIPSGWTVVTE